MELIDIKDRLSRLDSDKLIDVVKNYRQYGYKEDTREFALTVLEQRGITKSDLQLTGNMENARYEYVKTVYDSFTRHSSIAFVLYLVFIITFFMDTSIGWLAIAQILSFVLFIIFLLISFLDQNKFYKLAGDEFGSSGALIYVVLGMPCYIVMYFVFKNQMKEKLNTVT